MYYYVEDMEMEIEIGAWKESRNTLASIPLAVLQMYFYAQTCA